jgi:hypothetical protein
MNAPLRPGSGPLTALPPELIPSVDHLVTEDDTPVDSIYAEKQERLLTSPLFCSWPGPGGGGPFLATANVGLFYGINEPPVVPDILLALVHPPTDLHQKSQRSYFVWVFGQLPHVVIEVVSNQEGEELGGKKALYARIGIPYYVVWDPFCFLSKERLQLFELHGRTYKRLETSWLADIGLGLTIWRGVFEDVEEDWLRWCDEQGQVLMTGAESAHQAEQRAGQAEQRAGQAEQRAGQAEQRAEQAELRAQRLAEQLRQAGIDPQGSPDVR